MKVFAWIMGLVGTALLVGGTWILMDTQRFVARADAVQGTVIELLRTRGRDGGTMFKPLVRYETLAGAMTEFASSAASRPAAYEVGEAVTVLYDPSHPDDVRLKGSFSLWGMPIVLLGVGAVLFLISAGVGLRPLWRARRARRLRERGDLVLTTFDRAEHDTTVAFNGRHPWRVHAHWVDPLTGQRHAFRSDMLWEDPSGRWDQRAVPVYIERGRPQHYAMDLATPPGAGGAVGR